MSIQLTEETEVEIFMDVNGVQSAVFLVLHNKHYKEQKFTLTFKGDALKALIAEDVLAKLETACTACDIDRDRALDAMRAGSPDTDTLVEV